MEDRRHKNAHWKIEAGDPNADGGVTVHGYTVMEAVLMDIRDELQTLVRIFQCPNFQGMPWDVKKLVANTRKPKKKRPSIKLRRVA